MGMRALSFAWILVLSLLVGAPTGFASDRDDCEAALNSVTLSKISKALATDLRDSELDETLTRPITVILKSEAQNALSSFEIHQVNSPKVIQTALGYVSVAQVIGKNSALRQLFASADVFWAGYDASRSSRLISELGLTVAQVFANPGVLPATERPAASPTGDLVLVLDAQYAKNAAAIVRKIQDLGYEVIDWQNGVRYIAVRVDVAALAGARDQLKNIEGVRLVTSNEFKYEPGNRPLVRVPRPSEVMGETPVVPRVPKPSEVMPSSVHAHPYRVILDLPRELDMRNLDRLAKWLAPFGASVETSFPHVDSSAGTVTVSAQFPNRELVDRVSNLPGVKIFSNTRIAPFGPPVSSDSDPSVFEIDVMLVIDFTIDLSVPANLEKWLAPQGVSIFADRVFDRMGAQQNRVHAVAMVTKDGMEQLKALQDVVVHEDIQFQPAGAQTPAPVTSVTITTGPSPMTLEVVRDQVVVKVSPELAEGVLGINDLRALFGSTDDFQPINSVPGLFIVRGSFEDERLVEGVHSRALEFMSPVFKLDGATMYPTGQITLEFENEPSAKALTLVKTALGLKNEERAEFSAKPIYRFTVRGRAGLELVQMFANFEIYAKMFGIKHAYPNFAGTFTRGVGSPTSMLNVDASGPSRPNVDAFVIVKDTHKDQIEAVAQAIRNLGYEVVKVQARFGLIWVRFIAGEDPTRSAERIRAVEGVKAVQMNQQRGIAAADETPVRPSADAFVTLKKESRDQVQAIAQRLRDLGYEVVKVQDRFGIIWIKFNGKDPQTATAEITAITGVSGVTQNRQRGV